VNGSEHTQLLITGECIWHLKGGNRGRSSSNGAHWRHGKMMGDGMPLQHPILIQCLVHTSGARQVSVVPETPKYVVKGLEVMVQSLSIDQPIM
jgi:hypothetical protein